MATNGIVFDALQPNAADAFVSYSTENGAVQALYNSTQCIVVSPEMHVQFPKLTKKDLEADKERGIDRKYPELEITMRDAGADQLAFKAFMDGLDDKLTAFMSANQQTLGLATKKKGVPATTDEIRMMLRQTFRSRCSQRTGRIYPDAMSCKYRQPLDSDFDRVPVFNDKNQEHTAELESGDIVKVALIYTGCYAKSRNFFGNSWSLISIRFIRKSASRDHSFEPGELFGPGNVGNGTKVDFSDGPSRALSRGKSCWGDECV